MLNDEIREAIERAVNDVGGDSYQIWFAGTLNALADEPAVRMLLGNAAREASSGPDDVKWDTLTDRSQELWGNAMGAALKALAKECGK